MRPLSAVAISKDLVAFVAQEGLVRSSARQTSFRTSVFVVGYVAVLATALSVDTLPVWIASWFVLAIVLHSGFAAVHEATHGHLYESRWANRLAGFLWGAAVLQNFSLYRAFHLEHHSHTRTDGDPEPQTEFTSAAQYVFGLPFFGLVFWAQYFGQSVLSLAGVFPDYARTARQRAAIRRDAALILGLAAVGGFAAWQWPMVALKAWFIPFWFSTVLLTLFTLPEHYGCDRVPDYFRSTRTTLTNPVVRFLFWNNNFHAAHHIYPAVPYNHLGRLHDYTVERTTHVSRSYTEFHLGLVRSLMSTPAQAKGTTPAPR